MTDEPADTELAIMEATFEAVCKHGYADVTMQDIADEFDKSKSLLHYHHHTKEELFGAFLEHLVDQYEEKLDDLVEGVDSPNERLREFVNWFTVGPEETERTSLHLALLEMRSQAQHNQKVREQFRRSDSLARAAITTLIKEGQAAGSFNPDADAAALAQLCFVTMDGARARQVTVDETGYASEVAETLLELIFEHLDAPGE